MDWRITIIKADNGYILEAPIAERTDESGNDIVRINREVVEDVYETSEADRYETDDADQIAFARMLEKLAEYFGHHYEKFNKNNLSIKFNLKGHKVYEGEEEGAD